MGWLQKGEGGGACEVLPLRKVGAEKVLAMLKWGRGTRSFGVVFTCKLKDLAILKGCAKVSTLQKGGLVKFYPVLRGGGGAKRFRTRNFPIL